MKVLFVASECSPIAKVGGLADVVGSLPRELQKIGIDISIAIPFYQNVNVNNDNLKLKEKKLEIIFDGAREFFEIWETSLFDNKTPVFLIKNDKYFGGGSVYLETDASSGGSEREARRFLFFSAAALKLTEYLRVDILHCHDWHTAIIPYLGKTHHLPVKTVLTIHNLGYQGVYSSETVNKLLETEFSGEVNCLRLGILHSDFITTVSPTYAQEIIQPEFGFGLDDVLRGRADNLLGILNGLDLAVFNPKTDFLIEKRYSGASLDDKLANKIYLQNKCFGRVDQDKPIFGIVSRLASQKGVGLIRQIIRFFPENNCQFILLGQGAPEYETFFQSIARKFPDSFWVKIGFDEKLAHQIYAGSDIFLMPSHYEPCGLGQMIAMRYGTVPIAREIGGLKDTITYPIIDNKRLKGTGFLFQEYTKEAFLAAIKSALDFYTKKDFWRQIRQNAMKQDFSWKNSAQKYGELYKKL